MSDIRLNHKIYNKTLTDANTEYSQALTSAAKFFSAKCRTLDEFKLTLVSGESGSKYLTIRPGAVWSNPVPTYGVKTLYMQSPVAGIVIEIEEWT